MVSFRKGVDEYSGGLLQTLAADHRIGRHPLEGLGGKAPEIEVAGLIRDTRIRSRVVSGHRAGDLAAPDELSITRRTVCFRTVSSVNRSI